MIYIPKTLIYNIVTKPSHQLNIYAATPHASPSPHLKSFTLQLVEQHAEPYLTNLNPYLTLFYIYIILYHPHHNRI